ncbi:hypothetical protein CNMCM8927_004734 [Aspergillus lentulus]|uniref:Something about silencing protein 4 domain-containing protein n=1 Tax=Aspergillus lentulus TaxID=293939 RepID=A0AAN6BR55_ASPLE|nr:hypothetical protein CNMCM8927_004734 [Aspergillus lentulus]
MAVRSRSSLRFSVRRDDNTSGHHDDHQDNHHDTLPSSPPPAKRPRLQQQQRQQHRQPPSSRRRKSSPDLLDTTIENSGRRVPPSSKTPQIVRQAAHSPLPPPPRSSTRRPPAPSTASDSASSSSPSSVRVPPPGTPHTTGQSHDHHRTPLSASAALYMRGGGRESPDPLDIISPVPTGANSQPRKTPTTSTPTSTTRSTRRSRPRQSGASDADAQKTPGQTSSRRKPNSANPQTETQSQPKEEPDHPSPAAPEQRRSLRSKDSNSRLRSELASYFWNYEQILSLDPPKTVELLTENTTIKLIDDLTEPLTTIQSSTPDSESQFGNPLLQLHDCEKISLPEPEPEPKSDAAPGDVTEEDPLNEGYYFRAHRRMERQEKQLRNIERERAQHEKMQLERLLDELKGHDWLRVMGITGIHEHEKKLYEPKRDYFMREIASLIEKFQIWKEEEKRRKLDKDKPSLHAETSPSTAPTSRDRTTSQKRKLSDRILDTTAERPTPNGAATSDAESDGEPPDPSDVDAWAAHQLQQEARSATAGKRPKPSTEAPRRRKSSANKPSTALPAVAKPATPPPPDKPFTSFYAKPHLRDAALSPHRKGRVRLAFGHPIPKMEVREFQPPADILTPEAIDSCRRKRRRMRRESRG